MFPLNRPIDPAGEQTDRPDNGEPADPAVEPEEKSAGNLPTMADLDRLSVALDDVDDTLDHLDRRG